MGWQTTPQEWVEALRRSSPIMHWLAEAAVLVARSQEVQQWRIEDRRSVADIFTWLREVVVAASGHLAGATRISKPRGKGGAGNKPDVVALRRALAKAGGDRPDEGRLHSEVEDIAWRAQRDTLRRYLHLGEKDKAAAAAFLSRALNPRPPTEVRLEDEAGRELHPEETLDVITDHVIARSELSFEPDPRVGEWVARRVQEARAEAATQRDEQDAEFTPDEVDEEITRCVSHKKCLRGALVVLKAKVPEARQLSWALMVLVQ